MKKTLLALLLLGSFHAKAADTLFIKQPQVPILIERHDNILLLMRLNATETKTLDNVELNLDKAFPLHQVKALRLYYGGTEARQDVKKQRFAPVDYLTNFTPGKTLRAIPSYVVLRSECKPTAHHVTLQAKQQLFPGVNYFWISIEMQPNAPITTRLKAVLSKAVADGKALTLVNSAPDMGRRMGIGVRHAGDDGVAAYRIPGLVTTNKGTLLGVYDVRYNNSVDLQEHIDVGLSRSTDKGKTWEPMRLPLAFGENGGLPAAQNGVGDPAILVDNANNTIWIVAIWAHGMGNQRAWFSSQSGIDKAQTAQLVMAKSTDDGRTWSAPINLTAQLKHPEWHFFFQGPGRGITCKDGTLVFAMQFVDRERVPHAGIMYSKDHGKTWAISAPACANTTEAQVAELPNGELMLNMRNQSGGGRAVYTTRDWGKTWQEHSSNIKALQEPICMGSLISVAAKDNVLGRNILLFANPNDPKERKNITIKLSFDDGKTWESAHQVLLDDGYGWGYSCLTMIDRETVGILYESSVAQMTFQAIPLKDFVTGKMKDDDRKAVQRNWSGCLTE